MLSKDLNEILTSELFSITGGLFAGIMLAVFFEKIFQFPGLLILIPGFLEMSGALGGSLSSRISSGLFLGVIKPHFGRNPILKSNIIATIVLFIMVSFFLGVFAFFANKFLFGINNVRIIPVALIAGIVSMIITQLTAIATLWLFKKGHDPNNFMGPVITTLGDIVSVISFMIAIVLVT